MTGDATILGFLGRALSFELSAAQQYLALARLLQLRGMPELGQTLRGEAMDEMGHAERIIARMLALGVAPNASQLRPPRLDGSVSQLLQHAAHLEQEIIQLYSRAVDHCQRQGDEDNRLFFADLLHEEQSHAGSIEQRRQSLAANLSAQDKHYVSNRGAGT